MPLHRAVIWYLAVAASVLAGCKTTEVPVSSVYELLPGTWGLRHDKRYGCDVNPYVIRFSEDRKEITLTSARPAGADAGEPTVTRLKVLSDSPRLRVFRHGERQRVPSTNQPVIWDLVMLSPNEHCWHRPDRLGSCGRRAVRCPVDQPAASAALEDVPVAPESAEATRIQTMVEKAAALIESRGKAAFEEFRKPDSEWWSGQSYLFPKPGDTQPSQKWSYVKSVKIDGVPGIVGAGFYPEPDPPE